MKRLSLVLLSCSTALQGPPRVTSCTRRPATDDAAEVPAVIDDETLERELPIDFGSSDTQWTFEWPAVGDEPWSVRDVAGGGAMFAACHIASGALGAPIAVRLAGTGAFLATQATLPTFARQLTARPPFWTTGRGAAAGAGRAVDDGPTSVRRIGAAL